MGTPSRQFALRVLVLDEHDLSRVGLGLLLRRVPEVGRCYATGDEGEALLLAAQHQPRIAVVGISPRAAATGSIVPRLRSAAPGIRIVVVSHWQDSVRARALAVGADAFVPAGSSGQTTVEAVLALTEGRPISPAPAPQEWEALTFSEREREVLEGLVDGLTNREIAAKIHLSPETVKKHAQAIFRKLGVRNRTEASRFVSVLRP